MRAARGNKRTELSAEFQRLNVLLLRTGTGRRIGTALLTDAKVDATMSQVITASGSLGGLQVMNLVSASPVHQRIISIGKEPLVDDPNLSFGSTIEDNAHAFTFEIEQKKKDVGNDFEDEDNFDTVTVSAQLSSVVYIHSSTFLAELNSCADDFKRCMALLAQSISAAATDLALGIVQRRTETLGGGREMTPGRFGAGDTLTPSHSRMGTLKRGTQLRDLQLHPPAPTPRQPEAKKFEVNIELNLLLATPVVVFPRNESSLEVLVAHLGQITVSNQLLSGWDLRDDPSVPLGSTKVARYNVQVHHVNLNSLNLETKLQRKSGSTNDLTEKSILSMTALHLYDSSKFGVPILHDTNLEIIVDKIEKGNMLRKTESFYSGFYVDPDSSFLEGLEDNSTDLIQVKGKVINPLKVSLSRNQYQQLLDTLKSPTKVAAVEEKQQRSIFDTDSGKSSHVRRDLFQEKRETVTPIEGRFELPVFSLELRRDALNSNIEPGIVSLTFTEFGLTYEKHDNSTNTMQMALKGLLMEDLLLSESSPHRNLMVSSACPPSLRRSVNPSSNLSRSCPDLAAEQSSLAHCTSLPDKLDTRTVFGVNHHHKKKHVRVKERSKSPSTPPPSTCSSPLLTEFVNRNLRNEENLVHISILNVDSSCNEFQTVYDGVNKFVNVDFNSLDINFNLQTWVVILDFFGIGSVGDEDTKDANIDIDKDTPDASNDKHITTVDVQVKSLAICFNKSEHDLFKASVLNFESKTYLRNGNFEIEGQLGNFCIKDFTNYGFLYRDRFLCRGEQILKFKIFKFGQKDEELKRDCDIEVNLKMASITYVHTQRFWSVLMDFFNQFQQLQETLNSHRVSTRRQGKQPTVGFTPPAFGTGRGSRIKLNIQVICNHWIYSRGLVIISNTSRPSPRCWCYR